MFPTAAQELKSAGRRESYPEKDEQRTGSAIEPLRDGLIPAQSLAETGSEPGENQAPDRAGGHKGEPEHEESGDLHAGSGIDELGKKCEKE